MKRAKSKLKKPREMLRDPLEWHKEWKGVDRWIDRFGTKHRSGS